MQGESLLREEIEQRIAHDPRVSGRVDVEVNERRVRLSGVVDTLEAREVAEAAAREFGPVALDNDIVISSYPQEAVDDNDVLAASKRAIARNPDLAHDIGVDRVVDGVVYLKGRSDSVFSINQAADIVAKVPGAKDVASEVKIRTDVLITDVDLRDEVAQALHATMPQEAEFIGVRADDGVVTLDGPIKSIELKSRAGAIASQMPGARRIINNLTVEGFPTSIDQAIEDEVMKALEIAPINMNSARVSVLDGVAHLDGTVDTIRQKDLADRIARQVPGVRFVQNDLTIGFHIEKSA